MIQKIFFFFMIGISVCVAKPSEVVPASRGQDPLENRKQWQQEYRQILAQEKNQIKPPSQARNPRYMKRLYMDLKRMNDRIEAKQKKRLEEIARQNPKNPELVRQEKERMEKNRVFGFDADLGEQTDKNISIQEKEAALNNKIVKDPRAFYQEVSSSMLFSEGFNQQKIQETTSFFKKSYIPSEQEKEEMISSSGQNGSSDKNGNVVFSLQERQKINEVRRQPRLNRRKIIRPSF